MQGDAPDDTAATIDLFASEYGWSLDSILALTPDQSAQLVHAILWRKGVKVFRSNPAIDNDAPSLADRLKAMQDAVFDTTQESDEWL